MSLLRAWLIGTAIFLIGAMVWAFAPILVPAAMVLVGLGGLVAIIVTAARAFERRRGAVKPPD